MQRFWDIMFFDALLEHKKIIARIIHSGSNDNPAKQVLMFLKFV